MPRSLRRFCAELPFFILACILVGFMFSTSSLSVRDHRFQALFLENAVTALCIGLCAFTGGFLAYHRLRPAATLALYAKSLVASLIAGALGRTLAVVVHKVLRGDFPLSGIDLALSYIPALTMTFLISSGYILYWRHSDAAPQAPAQNATLEIRVDGKLCYLPALSICYLTAAGKKTIVHTEFGEYTVNMLLKEFLSKFPVPGLLRSHKKYAVQIKAIDYLRHNQSGEYLAGLSGEAFVVPVSPKFLPQIRSAKMG